jgi:LysR family hydrogen peroxide-inducible transcriptional activator
MNLRDLEYVLAVEETGHFGRAAERCHVSQPTLSGQIKKLEDELGVTLFERGRGGARATATGKAVIAQAKLALRAATEIRSLAQAAQDPLAGEFKLGLIPTVAPYLIPRFVARLRDALPDLTMIYREDITERLVADLEAGDIDAAILATPPETDALEAIPLYTEPFRLVFPDGHTLSSLAHLRMADVDRDDVLLLTEGHCFRDQALAICDVPSHHIASRDISGNADQSGRAGTRRNARPRPRHERPLRRYGVTGPPPRRRGRSPSDQFDGAQKRKPPRAG